MSHEIIHHPITGEPQPPAIPAATMVIFRNNPNGTAPLILMMERAQSMAFAAGAVVFPGGKVDDHDRAFAAVLDHEYDVDEAAARLAVIRETIEEAGLALALSGVTDPSDCGAARQALFDGASLKEICDQHGWIPQLDSLIPWARWRPLSQEIRIFDTRFYLIDAGDANIAGKVDNTENRALFWDSAQGVLDRIRKGEAKAIFPTVRNLERLAQWDSFKAAASHASDFPVRLLLTWVEERGGVPHVCFADDHGYPVTSEAVTTAARS